MREMKLKIEMLAVSFFSLLLLFSPFVFADETKPIIAPAAPIPPIDYHLSGSPTPNPLLSNTHYHSKKSTNKKVPVNVHGGAYEGQGGGSVNGKVGGF
jgi:hypothetical protein